MPLVFVRQPCVIDSQAMQDRRVEVEYRNRIARDVVAEVICFADGHARLDAVPIKKTGKLNFGNRAEDIAFITSPVAESRCLAPPPVYALTRICPVEYIKRMESVFEIIAEPNRRAILSLLVSSQQSVGEIERQLRMPQPTVSKHLRVLREAGFVESTVDAQRRLYRLKPEPLQEVDAWLAPFRRFWSAHVDALERHLDRMDQSAPTKRKTRRK